MPKHAPHKTADSPAIPDKLYFRIGEVAKLCGVETYVLRFWESEFPQLKPNKSGTGQRLYRKRDVEMALRVKRLLHDEGYTIAGARQVFAVETRDSKGKVLYPELPLKGNAPSTQPATAEARLQRLRAELRELLGMLSQRPQTRERKPRAGRTEELNLFENDPQ
jgi:DNA-binding transcriptional MerR regulator